MPAISVSNINDIIDRHYVELARSESYNSSRFFGIKILVSSNALPNLKDDKIQDVVYAALQSVSDEINAAIDANDPESQARRKQEREKLIALFPTNIFVEEIPNGYHEAWYTRNFPWYVVTTHIGRFKIGWRKRVIHLEWTETVGTKTVDDLFPDENVTKHERMIHAWGYDKAQEYVEKIFSTASV